MDAVRRESMSEGTERPARSRWWPLKLLLALYFAYAGIRILGDPEYRTLFGGVNFGVHELGHLVFSPFGEFMAVAGGSLAQLLLPIAAAVLFATQRDRYAVAICVMWLAISLADVAIYAGDARALELELVSMSDDGGDHDWNYLLRSMNILNADLAIARSMRIVSVLLLAGGTIMAAMSSFTARPKPIAAD